MRILHTIPGRNWGGMEHRTLEQVRWLQGHGHTVWLASPADGESFHRAQAQGLPVVDFDFDRPWSLATIRAIRALVRALAPDVADTHVTRDAKALLACLDLCPLVRSRHVNQPLKPSWLRRRQWRLSDWIITVAECTREHLIDRGLADPSRSVSVGGWADERFFDLPDPAATRSAIRTEAGIPMDAFVLLCVGMLRPDKGQNFLIDALDLLQRRGLAPTVLLAGEATAESAVYEDELKRKIAAAGLNPRVIFLGYRDDISQLMQSADAVVIPSLTEAQPRVAVQAFATGRPVVASAVGGVPEIVHDGQTGLLVPPADPAALADALARTMTEPEKMAALARGARELAEGTMRFDHRMAQTLAAYDAAIAHARKRCCPRLKIKPSSP